ncbi:uncharacterized protein NESG_01161 [Nematocida ausubeli]|uniref:PH domain-containing protein n=1 Tax=Nematocida ausubeli (strain ATCC PRA-371 / ERTm2) TaxID=1913371 RepID=A0A086J1N1_NEMA1|nr:uncharacterized protein NESG_01161 [Nematocida ausubeli]KFG26049.1 hypothetical protein NESG_01161 [Nematocida ausubeli]
MAINNIRHIYGEMGLMDKITEVAKNSEKNNKNTEEKEKQTADSAPDAQKSQPQKLNEAAGNSTATNKPSEMDVINSISEKPAPSKSLKEKLKASESGVEVHSAGTGMEGGLSISEKRHDIVKPSVSSSSSKDAHDPMSLVNKGTEEINPSHETSLKGGLENKTSSSDVNSGKIHAPIDSFTVSGGLGSGIAENIKKKKHGNVESTQSKPIVVDTNSGYTEKSHKSKDDFDTSFVEHSHKNKHSTDETKDKAEPAASSQPLNPLAKSTEVTGAQPGRVAGLVSLNNANSATSANVPPTPRNKPTDPVLNKGPSTSSQIPESKECAAPLAASGAVLGAGAATNQTAPAVSAPSNQASVAGSTINKEVTTRNEISNTENGRVATREIEEKTTTEKAVPISKTEAAALGIVGASAIGASAVGASTNGTSAVGASTNGTSTAGTSAVGAGNPASQQPSAQTSDQNRRYESKPEAASDSSLTLDRNNGKILYEADIYKKRYFLQFLWTKRHFTLSKDGIIKYYRNINGRRRGEFDIDEYFMSFKPTEVKRGKYPYRITLVSDKCDDLGFETKEQRDEFLFWLKKAAE